MKPQQADWIWLDEYELISQSDLAQVCELSTDDLQELVEYGALAPVSTRYPEPLFSADCVARLRSASRLRRDYDLDVFTVGLLMASLSRIEVLERQNRSLRAAASGRL